MKKAVVLLLIALLTTPLVFVVGCGNKADIHEAAKSGDWDTVIKLLDRGEAVDKKDSSGNTPLLNALSGYQFFLGKGGKPGGDRDEVQQQANCKDIAMMLIRKGADVNAGNDAGVTPLHRVAGGMDDEDVFLAVFYAPGADINIQINGGLLGGTPLHWAALEAEVETVKFLLDNGAEVNIRNERGETPLVVVEDEVAEEEKWSGHEYLEPDEAYIESAREVIRILRAAGGTR